MRKYCWLMLVMMLPQLVFAQVRVVRALNEKIILDMSGLKAVRDVPSTVFRNTLETDISRSGWLAVAGAGRGEYVLQGEVTLSGDKVVVKCQVYYAPTKKLVLNNIYHAETVAVRGLAHRVANEILFAITQKKGFFTARLALCGTRSGHKELYLCDSDGQNLRQLTQDKTINILPQWSPDGQALYYTTYRSGFPDVAKLNLESGRIAYIANYPGLNSGGAVSPDGRYVALMLSKDGNPDLYVKELSSGRLSRLTRTSRADEASPTWSPDGNRIAYVSDQPGSPQIYTISRSGGEGRRLTSRGSQNVAPDWGPDGRIAYSSLQGGRFMVCVMDPETLEAKVVSPSDANYEDPSWVPDGRHLACSVTRNYRSSICLLDTMGDPPVTLIEGSGDWSAPAWSPR